MENNEQFDIIKEKTLHPQRILTHHFNYFITHKVFLNVACSQAKCHIPQ